MGFPFAMIGFRNFIDSADVQKCLNTFRSVWARVSGMLSRIWFPRMVVFFGGILVFFGVRSGLDSKSLVDRSIWLPGTIVKQVPYMSERPGKSSALVYLPVIEYTNPDGNKVQLQSKYSSRAEMYHDGDKVRLLYDPKDPNASIIGSFFALWMWPSVMFFSGLPFMLLGLWRVARGVFSSRYID